MPERMPNLSKALSDDGEKHLKHLKSQDNIINLKDQRRSDNGVHQLCASSTRERTEPAMHLHEMHLKLSCEYTYLLKSESTTTSPITPKQLESECTPSKPKKEDLFKLEMIEVDQAIRSPKSPDWSPRVTFLDYSTDVFSFTESDSKSEVVVRDVFYDLLVNIKAINKEIAAEVCRNRWLHDVPPPYHNSCLRSPGGERALRKRRIYCLH
nr:hypothetical protein [Tanacetum cinerariifolium]